MKKFLKRIVSIHIYFCSTYISLITVLDKIFENNVSDAMLETHTIRRFLSSQINEYQNNKHEISMFKWLLILKVLIA